MALASVGSVMTWGEAWRLTRQLMLDPASHVSASASGWERPLSVEALLLLDHYDATVYIGTHKKPDPHPVRPKPLTTERRGKTTLTQDEVIDMLRAAGHSEALAAQSS